MMSKSRFRVDDWMVFSCYAALVGSTICIHLAIANGLGAESYLFSIDQLNEFAKLFYAFTLLEHFILFGTKVTLVLLYLRILPSPAVSTAYRSLCWAFIGLLSLTFVATELATVLQCTPVASIWNSVYGKQGQCLNIATLQRASSALELIYSVALLFLPVPPLLAAKLSKAQNLRLICIYTTGLAVIICTLGRTIVSPTTPTSSSVPATLTSSLIQPTSWTILQVNLSIILICLPPLSNLLTYIPLRLKKSTILPHNNNNSAEEILTEEDRRRSGLTHQQQQMQTTTLEIPNKSFGAHRAARRKEDEDKINNESPGLHVGVGDSTVTFQHSIPKETTRDKVVYKDAEGRMHEVELIDRPALVVGEEGSAVEDEGWGEGKAIDEGVVMDEKLGDEAMV
ncbi:hypothetical protein CB0940_07621 [Cercospora beticola]|uniref:Rhodopsin domain-containing protein n=1 Tax=Cercospora beticola TaxID=122368 RepID=A0A2G5HAU4_CERBT|nr:hypothetical protein CB0940_07621 [Cercospora beticola]PIA89660.1 hypothetical protein CB0940_07621 [Cercospora beticola]WPB03586.1 hypothetical protein RHO25_008226 [Cercospora beticola]